MWYSIFVKEKVIHENAIKYSRIFKEDFIK